MAAGCINSTLPAEVLERIFRLLPNSDRKVVVGKILETETTKKQPKNFAGEGVQKVEGRGGAAGTLVLGHDQCPPGKPCQVFLMN